jgi:myo-inositol-1(or 4)-monophosphatase
MQISNTEFNGLRTEIQTAAREELLPRFARVERGIKADGSFITEADLAVQVRIEDYLRLHWPEVAFLGEEMEAEAQKALMTSGQPFWCLDPLDGTSNFAAGIPYYAVSLALISEGRSQLGIVYDPSRDECFSAQAGQGAIINDEALNTVATGLDLNQTTALIDFKRLPPELAARLVTERPYASQRSFGGVALDWCWLAAGRCHIYLHGRQNLWDYAAGLLVFSEAGGLSTNLDGTPLFVNDLVPRAAVGAGDPTLFKNWKAWLNIP